MSVSSKDYTYKELNFRNVIALYKTKTLFILFTFSIAGFFPVWFKILGNGLGYILYMWAYILLTVTTLLPILYILILPTIFNVCLLVKDVLSVLADIILFLIDLLITYLKGDTPK